MTLGTPVEDRHGRPRRDARRRHERRTPAFTHGFPVRMVVPGLYGYVSACKWLRELELTDFDDYDAYWVKRDWAREAPVKTQSRIDTPRPLASPKPGTVQVAGVAWAQHRGIARVEVRVDEGPWQRPAGRRGQPRHLAPVGVGVACHLRQPPLEVRATDGTGADPDRRTRRHRARRRHRMALGGGRRDLTPTDPPTPPTHRRRTIPVVSPVARDRAGSDTDSTDEELAMIQNPETSACARASAAPSPPSPPWPCRPSHQRRLR